MTVVMEIAGQIRGNRWGRKWQNFSLSGSKDGYHGGLDEGNGDAI
jgi:hypothetical protein